MTRVHSDAEGASVPTGALADIAAERLRQVQQEGWTPEHDDTHRNGEMALAAGAYAVHAAARVGSLPYASASVALEAWPWSRTWWKPKDPRRDLVRAGALIVAEIERLDRTTGAA